MKNVSLHPEPDAVIASATGPPSSQTAKGSAGFLAGGGEMGERMRSFDWARTTLGLPERWPPSLKAAVTLCLGSRFPIVIWWDREETIQLYNDAYISFLGPNKHPAFLGRSGRECWREIWDTMGPLWERVFATGEATWSEDFLYVINRRVPREEGYFTFSYSPIRGATEAVEGIFCACYETTGKVVGARRLETLRRLGEQAMEADSVANACARATAVLGENTHDIPFARIYHLDANRRLPADAIAPEALEVVLHTLRPTQVSGLEFPGGAWPEAATQALALPLFFSTHEMLAGVIVLGVSPRRPLDTEYQTFFNLIAGHVSTAMANARIREEERRRAEALAEIDRAKTLFFSNVSHEFRTPLTLMMGPVEDLLAKSDFGLSPVAKEQLEVVNRNGLRLLRLVNTLLDFSRIEAGRVQAVFEPTELGGFTSELASVFRSATERAGLALRVDCPRLTEPVYVDRDMWEKIVLNLLSNAFKFTFDGEIEVKLRADANHAILTVKDTGVGIPPEAMPRLFERFHRVQNVRSRTHEGSGIGLALVQELVKLHQGTITAQSRVGEGTTFQVHVPLGMGHLAAEHVGRSRAMSSTAVGAAPFVEEALRWLPEPPKEQPETGLARQDELLAVPCPVSGESEAEGRPRVLIADDNADMCQYVARLLAERYSVQTARDGAAALAAARERRPDLIVSDVMMPNLDGFGLVRELRADLTLKTVPVILLSARAGEESRVQGMQHGADDYLIKPFSARELLARVGAHLEMARMRQEAAEQIERSEERFRALVMAVSDVVYRMSPDWSEMRFLHGRDFLADTEAPERTWLQKYIPLSDQAQVMAVVTQAVRNQSVFDLEHRVVRADGSLGWAFSRAVPLRNRSGEIVEWFGAASDITGRKAAEEELRRNQAELERQVAERTARLQELVNELEHFSYTITHDMRAPLRAMRGVAEVLNGPSTEFSDGQQRNLLRRIIVAAERMDALITDALNYSKAVRQELPLAPVDTGKLLRGMLETYPELQGANADIMIQGKLPPVMGNEAALTQCFSNLLGNAVKFAKAGKRPFVRVWSEVFVGHGGSGWVRLWVEDDGVGISEAMKPRVFDMFSRGSHSQAGTGIGLALVRKVVDRMGGRVGVESEAGKGSRFWVELRSGEVVGACSAPT
jgi:signal transduction histidine kinase/CheY-like chemotaxis protein